MAQELQLTIEGKVGEIPFATFATIIRNSFDILSDLDSAISSKPRGSVEWFVSNLSTSASLTVSVISKSKFKEIDCSSKVAEVFVSGLNHIQEERTTPPYFSDYGLRRAQGVVSILRKNGAKGFKVTDIDRNNSALLQGNIADDLKKLINIRYKEIGSVEGRLEMISVHGAPQITIYHSITRRSVRCKFPQRLLSIVKDGLARRVIVSGMVYSNYIHEPVKVDVGNVEILPTEAELPTAKDLRGMSPEFTGNMSTEEYIRSLRE